MQPTLARAPFHRPGWVFETKYNGWRMLAVKERADVRLMSRQGVDHTARFGELAAAVAQLPARRLVLDGEVCVFDAQLVSQFHLLGEGALAELATPPVFIAFDMLRVGAPRSPRAAGALVIEKPFPGARQLAMIVAQAAIH